MNNLFIITGAPGTGKTLILKELFHLGHITINEPARQIIKEQREIQGEGVYDKNTLLFKELILSRAIFAYKQHVNSDLPVFFDRGIPDVLAYSDCFNIELGSEIIASQKHRYNKIVFYSPPWKAIYKKDDERNLSYKEASKFGKNLRNIYTKLGYTLVDIPFGEPKERASFIISKLQTSP